MGEHEDAVASSIAKGFADLAEHKREGIASDTAGRERAISNAERFVKYAWGFGAIIATVTAFVVKLEVETGRLAKEIEKSTARIEAIEKLRLADHELFQHLENTVVSNKSERVMELATIHSDITSLKDLAEKVNKMYTLYQLGLSNKEAYAREHGFPAPNDK